MVQGDRLGLLRCPYCKVARPNMIRRMNVNSADHQDSNRRYWVVYICETCGGGVLAYSWNFDSKAGNIIKMFPEQEILDEAITGRVREYFDQAMNSAPFGAVVAAAAAVDQMLKDKKYETGDLNSRIDQAAVDHVITEQMKTWAHQVRLDANAQRHADQEVGLPTAEEAEETLEFAKALAEYLIVLPAKVKNRIKPPEGER